MICRRPLAICHETSDAQELIRVLAIRSTLFRRHPVMPIIEAPHFLQHDAILKLLPDRKAAVRQVLRRDNIVVAIPTAQPAALVNTILVQRVVADRLALLGIACENYVPPTEADPGRSILPPTCPQHLACSGVAFANHLPADHAQLIHDDEHRWPQSSPHFQKAGIPHVGPLLELPNGHTESPVERGGTVLQMEGSAARGRTQLHDAVHPLEAGTGCPHGSPLRAHERSHRPRLARPSSAKKPQALRLTSR